MKRLKLFVLVFAVISASVGLGYFALNVPAGDQSFQRVITIPEGASLLQVAQLLNDEGLLRTQWTFIWMGRLTGMDRKVIPGEYALHAGLRPTEILSKILAGQVVRHSVTIPEGYTIDQIASLLSGKDLVDQEEFLRLVTDEDFIGRLNLSVSNLEGYLFPDTYFFTRPIQPQDIIRTFVNRLNETLTPELRARAKEWGMTVQEVLTLASLIEKEAKLPDEHVLISGVFHNRLRQGMPLQSDPTVIYALEAFDGDLRKKDLAVESPYNTYRVTGLPPGPIGNPGAAAIKAALYPSRTNFLYFVSRNDGSHEFSATLAEHNLAVEKYQRPQTKRSS